MARLSDDKTFDLTLFLCDRDPDVLSAWRAQFEIHAERVKVVEGSIFDVDANACLCPGNSFGFMDSGLAHHISETFGWELQDRMRESIRDHFDGELLVGQAVVAPTGGSPAWLVYAPTLRTPSNVGDSLNAYLALRGALLALRDHQADAGAAPIKSLAVPGLCTGAGRMHPLVSARQLRHAFEQITGLRGFGDKNLSQLARREAKLRSLPASAAQAEAEGA